MRIFFLLIATSESQSQAAHHQGLADTKVEGVVEWLDLDEEAECLLVQDVAHSNFFRYLVLVFLQLENICISKIREEKDDAIDMVIVLSLH